MSTESLSDAEALKLFNSVSKHIDDPEKISEIVGGAEPEETPAPEVVAEVEKEPEVVLTEEENKQEVQPDAGKAEAQQVEAPTSTAPNAEELERLIQENKLLQHKHRSESNRTAALQRKLNELEARLASLSTTASKPPTDKAAPATEEGEDQDLEDLKRTDPALYRIIKKREEAYKSQVESLKTTLTQELAPVRQAYQQQEVSQEKTRLQQLVPNIAEVVQSEAFKTFVDVAPEGVRKLVMSKSADEVVAGLQVYSSWLHQNGLVSQPGRTESAPVQTQQTETSSNLTNERERKLQQAVNVKSPAAPVKKEMTPQELFEQSYKQFHKLHGPS